MRSIKLPGEIVTTTFLGDFDIADKFGESGIRETFQNALDSWKNDYRYLTNLVVTLNYKSWEWSEKEEESDEQPYTVLYIELYEKARDYATGHLEGEQFKYFFNITD